MADEEGQIHEAHSISAGLDYPGVGPEHAMLRDTGRARYVAVDDEGALRALRELARLEGIVPALESAHAIAWVMGEGKSSDDGIDLVTLSGRGDKDLAEALAGLERLDGQVAESGVERIAAAFASARGEGTGGADAVPDGRVSGPRDVGCRDRRLRRHRR